MADDLESIASSKPFCGVLSKYTNVVKGWQNRWFVLNPSTATIEYYEREELRGQKPRGSLSVQASVIAPSDEDPVMFTVHAANGEIYRLRADNTKLRQMWVSRLRYVAQHSNVGGASRARSSTAGDAGELVRHEHHKSQTSTRSRPYSVCSLDDVSALTEVKEYLDEMYTHEETLADKIDHLTPHGAYINALDQDMLLLKACSRAALSCLEQCHTILELQHAARARNAHIQSQMLLSAKTEVAPNAKSKLNEPKQFDLKRPSVLVEHTRLLAEQNEIGFTQPLHVPTINHDEEVQDTEAFEEKDLGEMEQHKSLILHLLSQLKLGMDLTKVVLPTFILEKRSLLEMFADCMAHPDTFIDIADRPCEESRMMRVVEWYLTSFHEGRKGSMAKKPYNPIIGETFHCSWLVKDESNQTQRLLYTAEQVSHHPPVSAFYVTCPEKRICLNGSIWSKSKFMGMSIGVTMLGNITISLPEHDEEYVLTLPSAYARSILTYPWVELGDKCTISCRKTGFSASIIFHTKPFYGGKLHRITGEVKSNSGAIRLRINGEWNGAIELLSDQSTRVIETQNLTVHRKFVRPISVQGEFESRRLWQHVTNALRLNDINTATEHKTLLEKRQREAERHRKEKGVPFPTKYFYQAGDTSSWIYKNHMLKMS